MTEIKKDYYKYLGKKVKINPEDGYICATDACSAAGVVVHSFLISQVYKDNALEIKKKAEPMYVKVDGRNRKTWLHPNLRFHLTNWLKNLALKKKNHVVIKNPNTCTSFFYKRDINQYTALSNFFSLVPPEYQMDHIIPLNSSIICGLNVPWNTQIVPRYYNVYKSSHFNPDLFVEQKDKNLENINQLLLCYIHKNSEYYL